MVLGSFLQDGRGTIARSRHTSYLKEPPRTPGPDNGQNEDLSTLQMKATIQRLTHQNAKLESDQMDLKNTNQKLKIARMKAETEKDALMRKLDGGEAGMFSLSREEGGSLNEE